MQLTTQCCICGGGPAGMMLGYLLARTGIAVIVLEKHKDFLRDFRGDTIHPSTLMLMHELGIYKDFLQIPHQEIEELVARYNDTDIPIANFRKLDIEGPPLVLMPQWDFLNFISDKASAYSTFKLMMEAQVDALIEKDGRVAGVSATTPGGIIDVYADIIVGTDGRSSTVRTEAKLKTITTSVPLDVLWFALPRQPDDAQQTFGRFYHGSIMILLQRDTYWQCGYVIEKGGIEGVKKEGMEKLQQQLVAMVPFLKDRVHELKSFDDIHLLSVAIDHLETWYKDGLICIGDAAHAMSPIGGVGINLAIQDAVAAANILYEPLSTGKPVTTGILRRIQRRRELPARLIQRLQTVIQKGIVKRRTGDKEPSMPLPFRLLKMFPFLRVIPAKVIGMGFRPEHIHTPDLAQK